MMDSYFWRMSPFKRLVWLKFFAGGGSSSILKTVTGALIHITDALAKPAKKFVATLEPIQDLHGQDAPYPSGGGKNKLPAIGVNTTFQSIEITYNEDEETYTLNGTLTSPGNIPLASLPNNSINWVEGENYTLSCRVVSGSFTLAGSSGITYALSIFDSGSSKYIRGDTTQDESKLDGYYGTGKAFTSNSNYQLMLQCWREGTVFNNLKLRVQIESGSTPTSWSPYSNICPITGHTVASVVRTGKNLYNPNAVTDNSYLSTTTGLPEAQAGYVVSDYVPVIKNQGVIIPASGTARRWFYDKNKNPVTYLNNSGNQLFTPYDDGFIRASVSKTSIFYNTYIIAYGSGSVPSEGLPTEYEPYNGTTLSVTFPDAAGTVYGGTLTNEGGEWKLRVETVEYVVDGVNNYAQFSGVYCNIRPNGVLQGINQNPSTWKSNQFICSTYICGYNSSIQFLYFNQGGWSKIADNANDFNAYCQQHPIQFVIPLATPIEYTLTESQALTLLKGTNNVWCDASNDLELQYYAKAEETP